MGPTLDSRGPSYISLRAAQVRGSCLNILPASPVDTEEYICGQAMSNRPPPQSCWLVYDCVYQQSFSKSVSKLQSRSLPLC